MGLLRRAIFALAIVVLAGLGYVIGAVATIVYYGAR